MKIQNATSESLSLEMSRSEFLDIMDIVFTARSFYEALDPVPYELTEERVTQCANRLEGISDQLQSRVANG